MAHILQCKGQVPGAASSDKDLVWTMKDEKRCKKIQEEKKVKHSHRKTLFYHQNLDQKLALLFHCYNAPTCSGNCFYARCVDAHNPCKQMRIDLKHHQTCSTNSCKTCQKITLLFKLHAYIFHQKEIHVGICKVKYCQSLRNQRVALQEFERKRVEGDTGNEFDKMAAKVEGGGWYPKNELSGIPNELTEDQQRLKKMITFRKMKYLPVYVHYWWNRKNTRWDWNEEAETTILTSLQENPAKYVHYHHQGDRNLDNQIMYVSENEKTTKFYQNIYLEEWEADKPSPSNDQINVVKRGVKQAMNNLYAFARQLLPMDEPCKACTCVDSCQCVKCPPKTQWFTRWKHFCAPLVFKKTWIPDMTSGLVRFPPDDKRKIKWTIDYPHPLGSLSNGDRMARRSGWH